jgi:prophage antirepressor-like protein
MENKLQLFNFNGSEIRTVLIGTDIWFVASDVCDVLEIQNSRRSANLLDEDEKLMYTLCTSGQNRETWLVNESGLYSLTLTSRKPQAKAFKKWITSEVLPSIRKTGSYEVKPMSDSELMSRALLIAQQTLDSANKKVEVLEQEIERVEPMKQAYMHLIDSEGEYDLSTIAKMFKIGRNKLCTLLRQKKIFMQGKTEPYQEYIKKGWFRVTTKEIKPKFFVSQSLVTNKGLSNLRPLILGEKMDAILVA